MFLRQIVDGRLSQHAWLVGCPGSKEAVLVDPERDIDRYRRIADDEGFEIVAVAETHIHADFLSGARAFAERGVRTYLSAEGGEEWRYGWADPERYDVVLLRGGDHIPVGGLRMEALHTPGHTPEHLSYLVVESRPEGDEPVGILTGDFVFVGDVGRPDLLESAVGAQGVMLEGAERLFDSLVRFLELPDHLLVWPGHGAGSACGKGMSGMRVSTVGRERRTRPAVEAARRGREAFLAHVLEDQIEPPLYFGRMKEHNRDGPALLDGLPLPREVASTEIEPLLANGDDVVILDTRPGRSRFMAHHLPRALYAPLDDTFPTVAGSYVREAQDVVLVLEEARAEEAVRSLVRVGLERITGRIRPAAVEAWVDGGGEAASIEEIDVEELERRRGRPGATVLDVRTLAEYRKGHVPRALNVAHTRLMERLGELPGDRSLLVHCSTGIRSAVAAALLARHGFDVAYVNADFRGWLDAHQAEVGRPAEGNPAA